MVLEKIIVIAIIILSVMFVWAILKRLFKLLSYISIIIVVIIGVNAFFIYNDVIDLKKNFADSTKKIILVDNDKALTGLLLNDETKIIEQQELNKISANLANKDYERAQGESYKLMIFDIDVLSSLNDDLSMGESTISREKAISILNSSNDEMEKADLFESILGYNILTSKNPLFFFSQFKEGNIIVYPETALFKTVKIIPVGLVRETAISMFEKSKIFI